MPVLTALRPTGSRDFVLASNRLSEIAAGAAVVAWTTAEDGSGAAFRAGLGGGEVVARSGGDLLLRFAASEDARAFAARYSRLLHDVAPGLECAIVQRSYQSGGLAEALRAVRPALSAAVGRVRPSLRPLGLGVTAPCRAGGAPATEVIPARPGAGAELMPASEAIAWRRRVARDEIDERWRPYLPDAEATEAAIGASPYVLPATLNELTRIGAADGEVGVLHIEFGRPDRLPDRRLEEADGVEHADGAGDADEAALAACRAAAGAATDAGETILRAVLARAAAVGGASVLPARPLLWDGARLTVLCDGRLAEALASAALAASGAMRGRGGRGPGRVRVGMAVQPAAASLDAAYDLAAERCRTSGAPRVRGARNRPGDGRGRAAGDPAGGGMESTSADTERAIANVSDDTATDAPMIEEGGAAVAAAERRDQPDADGAGIAPAVLSPHGDDEDGDADHEAHAAQEADA